MNYTRHFKCGCKVVVIGELTNAQIEYCPKHKSARDLYEACKELIRRDECGSIRLPTQATDILHKALAKVEGNDERRR